MSSTPKLVTLSVEQTLTCTIGELDLNGEVVVTWRETSGGTPLINDDNYGIEQGTVNATGIQDSVLTIKAAKMSTLSGPSFTYKCSARSGQYPTSTESTELDVVANVATFGKDYKLYTF